MMSLVSIVLPNFNHSETIGAQIKAILSQPYSDIQLIIIDDASTDSSVEVITDEIGSDGRVIFLRNDVNLGVFGSITRGFDVATGKYFYGAGADDLILPNIFENLIPPMEKNQNIQISCGDPMWFWPDTRRLEIGVTVNWDSEPRFYAPTEIADRLQGGFLPSHSMVYRNTKILGELYCYIRNQSGLGHHADWWKNLVIAFRDGVYHHPDIVSVMRSSSDTYSGQAKNKPFEVKRALANALLDNIMGPRFQDVFNFVVRSNCIYHHKDFHELVSVFLSRPDLWSAENQLLMQVLMAPYYNEIGKRAMEERLESASCRYQVNDPGLVARLQNIKANL